MGVPVSLGLMESKLAPRTHCERTVHAVIKGRSSLLKVHNRRRREAGSPIDRVENAEAATILVSAWKR